MTALPRSTCGPTFRLLSACGTAGTAVPVLARKDRSASGLPADILELSQRGYLKPGYFADVVVLDPKTYREQATYEQPHQYATGVRYLFVNGRLAIDGGRFTGALAGKVLRHESKAGAGK